MNPHENRTCGQKGNVMSMEFTVELPRPVFFNETYDLLEEEFILGMAKVSSYSTSDGKKTDMKHATMGPKKLFDSRNVVSRNNGGEDLCKSASLRLVSNVFIAASLLAAAVMLMWAV